MKTKILNWIPRALCLTLLSISFGCSSEKPKVEAPPVQVARQNEAAQPQVASNIPPPDLNAVQDAVNRVFKDKARIDMSRKPYFVAGDFNGDGSQDIAVVLQPTPEKLADLNEEFPNWILKNPFAPGAESRVPRLRVAAHDSLLAVIHGYGTKGWRDPEATQTFLLKNAIGSGMNARDAKDVRKANSGTKTPHLSGDVISQVVNGSQGYLYFADATYSWYDPKTFQEQPETGMAHLRAAKQIRR